MICIFMDFHDIMWLCNVLYGFYIWFYITIDDFAVEF